MDVQNLFSNADNMALQQDAKPYFICCDFFRFYSTVSELIFPILFFINS